MSDIPMSGGNQSPKRGLLALVAVAAAAIAGTATVIENIDKIGIEAHKMCQGMHMCAPDTVLVPPMPAPPVLAPYDSPAMGGGHGQAEICGPQLKSYQTQYPSFDITLQSSEDSDKNWAGHVT